MLQILRNAWKIPDLRRKILFTLLMLLVFRLGSAIPVPGMIKAALEEMVKSNDFLGIMNTISGGAFQNASIFAMSITPYINASIIMQLLTVAIPSLERLAKEGEEGRKVIAQWTRYGTVLLGFIQATGLFFALKNAVNPSIPSVISYVMIAFTFTAGTAFLMWLGEQITEKGIGNGISLLIFAGIVSRIPAMLQQIIASFQNKTMNIPLFVLLMALVIAVIAFVVLMNQAERRIPVQYAKRVVGRKMYGGQSTHIPIKVSMAGVIPIIFAMSIMAFPGTIAQFIPNFGKTWFGQFFTNWLGYGTLIYGLMYFVMIIFFTYFYTAIYFNPIEIANNMKKNGGFIPGIRPGKPTSDYVNKVLSRITLAGAVFLGLIAVLPLLMSKLPGMNIGLGGTTLLIVVGVALETVKQIESQMLMRHYKGFLE